MSTNVKLDKKKLNRRIAFRIYEEANLFYHKIDAPLSNKTTSSFNITLPDLNQAQVIDESGSSTPLSPLEKTLPSSQSVENDTLQVNISSSGIAFTCKEELNRGDYLMLRILLLSNMTVIQACCKVVYCKPSNPYENDRYPYLIGAYFVNLTPKDKDLLNAHVNRKRKQQLVINSLISIAAITILALPAETFHLFLWLCHHVVALFLHALHVLLEFIELRLDHLIEHSFHTDLHETQIIVFYIMAAFGLVLLYVGWLVVPGVYASAIQNQKAFYNRKKSSFLYYWRHKSLLEKTQIIGTISAAIFCYFYFLF